MGSQISDVVVRLFLILVDRECSMSMQLPADGQYTITTTRVLLELAIAKNMGFFHSRNLLVIF